MQISLFLEIFTENEIIVPLNWRGACHFWLDPKVTKRSRQKKASTRSAGS